MVKSYRKHIKRVVLIETLWNVKEETLHDDIEAHAVLIETLWNVKRTSLFVLRILRSVLIETLWNVKRPEKQNE